MKKKTYPFVAEPLPYDYDALLPVLDEKTLHFHHDKHYQTYVDNLNSLLLGYPELHDSCLKGLLSDIEHLPDEIRTGVRNNGGGVFNHRLYFNSMQSPSGQMPTGELADAIERDFGSYDRWREQMKLSAVSKFGSGWAWLLTDSEGNLSIMQTANQDVPDFKKYCPLFLIDVWEHAYYLQYQNRRAEYVDGWFSLINWDKALARYKKFLSCQSSDSCHTSGSCKR